MIFSGNHGLVTRLMSGFLCHPKPRLDSGWTAKDDNYQFWKVDILARLNPGVQRKQAQTVLTGMFS